MSEDHQKRAMEWYLYLHSEKPLPPAKLVEAHQHSPSKTKTKAPPHPHPGPELSTALGSAQKKDSGTAQAGPNA